MLGCLGPDVPWTACGPKQPLVSFLKYAITPLQQSDVLFSDNVVVLALERYFDIS
jgi:hypothetical protein